MVFPRVVLPPAVLLGVVLPPVVLQRGRGRPRGLLCGPSAGPGSLFLFDEFQDFAVVRKTARGELRKDHFAVDFHVEYSAAAADEFHVRAERVFQLCLQTGGSGQVVSGLAVRDLDLHVCVSFSACGIGAPVGPASPLAWFLLFSELECSAYFLHRQPEAWEVRSREILRWFRKSFRVGPHVAYLILDLDPKLKILRCGLK